MSQPVGWALVVLAVVLFVIAYLRYRGIREELIAPDTSQAGATARAARSAVFAGRIPEDRDLAAATRALAKLTVNNYPLRWRYAIFTFAGVLALTVSSLAFFPSRALYVIAPAIVVGGLLAIQARAAHRGAQRILAAKPKR